jgi:cytochrome c-type biogenesis protein CcmH
MIFRRSSLVWATAAILAYATAVQAQTGVPAPPTAGPAAAESDPDLDARARAISAVLRCPVCQGESILDSPAELSQQMRAVVYDQLREGRTPEEIKAYFVASYGEWILLEPRLTGLNIVLYVAPVLFVIAGLALVALLVRRWTQPPPQTS